MQVVPEDHAARASGWAWDYDPISLRIIVLVLSLSHEFPIMIPTLAIALSKSAVPVDGFGSGMAKRVTWVVASRTQRINNHYCIRGAATTEFAEAWHVFLCLLFQPAADWWHGWNPRWKIHGTQSTHRLKVLLPNFLPYLGPLRYSSSIYIYIYNIIYNIYNIYIIYIYIFIYMRLHATSQKKTWVDATSRILEGAGSTNHARPPSENYRARRPVDLASRAGQWRPLSPGIVPFNVRTWNRSTWFFRHENPAWPSFITKNVVKIHKEPRGRMRHWDFLGVPWQWWKVGMMIDGRDGFRLES